MRKRIDAVCALALFLFAAALAVWVEGQFRQSRIRPDFFQAWFAPAVLFACGDGFRNADWSHDEALKAFLLQERDKLACGELSGGLTGVPLDLFQRIALYLEWAVALTWRMAGVSWDAVSWVAAILAGIFAAMVYGVMRLGMRPFAAATFSTVVVTSPLHLSYVPQLRDYSKAPFLLALVLLMGIAVKRSLSSRQWLTLSALGGCVAGVGFGFRTDVLLAAVVFLVTLFVFRAGSPSMRSRLTGGAAAFVVFIAAFALTAAPVLSRYAKGGTIGHVILLGFGEGFTAELGLEATHYQLAIPYSDSYVETIVRSYTSRVDGDAHAFAIGSAEYDRESRRYLMNVIRTFPADVAVRALSAVVHVLDAPFSRTSARATDWVHSPLVRRMYDRRADAIEWASSLGWLATGFVIAAVAAWSVRCAAFMMFIVLCLAGGAALQFGPRHFFYLEFMPWWAVGAMVDRAAAAGRAVPQVIRDREWHIRARLVRAGVGVVRSAAFVVVGILVTGVVLRATRHYQQQGMNQLFERSLAAAGQPLDVAIVPHGEGRVTMTVDLPELDLSAASWQSRSIGTAYLLVDVNPERCDSWNFSAEFRYNASLNNVDFTTSVAVPMVHPQLGSSLKILVPVHAVWFGLPVYGGWSPAVSVHSSQFSGIDLSRHDATCVTSISRVGDLGSMPVLVSAVLGPDWRSASHYQTMMGVERREDGVPFQVRTYPTLPTLEVGRSVMSQMTTDIWSRAVLASRVTTRLPPSGVAVNGTSESSYAYMLQSRERAVSRGTCAVADGELARGGLTFGILRDRRWYQQVNIVKRGRFIAVGCALEDGTYSIVLANDNPAGGVTTARLDKIGWLGAGPELYTFPAGLAATAKQFTRTKAILQSADVTFEAKIVRAGPSGWTIKGASDGAYSYLLVSKPQILTDDRLLSAAGSITRGGLTIGLVRDGAWAAQVNVTDVGAFTVVIQPPGAGTYQVIVANDLPDASRETDVAISRIAWMGR